MEVKIDFLEDWRQHLLTSLQLAGYTIDASQDVDAVTYTHHNMLRREVMVAPRRVHEPQGFICPLKSKKGYKLLKRKVESGVNVNPHLSENLIDITYEDPMLNDWGIHHFHLGHKLKRNGFINRTGPLVYAYITDTDFYVLGVFGHGRWTYRGLIKVIHKNWPHLIRPYRAKGVVGLARDISDATYKKLRGGRLNVLIEVAPGVIYIGPGGGIATSNGSLEARWRADRNLEGIERLQEYVTDKASEYLLEIEAHGRSVNGVLDFQLIVTEGGFSALEKSSNVRFTLPPIQFT